MNYSNWKDAKEAWLKALRSGKYRQGSHRLHTQLSPTFHTYCCLGVLCEVMGVPSVKQDESFFYDNNDRWLPRSIFLVVPDILNQHKLAAMNDGDEFDSIEKYSFEDIADYVEKTY